jgi:hypothetical protein
VIEDDFRLWSLDKLITSYISQMIVVVQLKMVFDFGQMTGHNSQLIVAFYALLQLFKLCTRKHITRCTLSSVTNNNLASCKQLNQKIGFRVISPISSTESVLSNKLEH